jgi:hypothetical protein
MIVDSADESPSQYYGIMVVYGNLLSYFQDWLILGHYHEVLQQPDFLIDILSTSR